MRTATRQSRSIKAYVEYEAAKRQRMRLDFSETPLNPDQVQLLSFWRERELELFEAYSEAVWAEEEMD